MPPPPRPPRDTKKQRKQSKFKRDDDDSKLDRDGGGERITGVTGLTAPPSFDESSRVSSQEIEETEAATQTDPLPADYSFEEFEITEDMRRITPNFNNNNRNSKTIEDLLREDQEAELERARQLASEQNLAKSINKFREANQRTYSERSRTSGGSRGSRPITPSAMVIEQRIIVSTTETDAVLLVAPIQEAENRPLDYRTDSKESEDVPYLDENITTEDERIVSEAIRRYQLLDPQFKESSSQHSAGSSHHDLADVETDVLEDEPIPLPPPRRKSSAIDSNAADEMVDEHPTVPSTAIAPIAEVGTLRAETETLPLHRGRIQIDELEVDHLNVRQLQAGQILVSDLHGASITTDDLECRSGNITVRGIELPIDFIRSLVDRSTARAVEIVNELTAPPPTPQTEDVTPQSQLPSNVQSADGTDQQKKPESTAEPDSEPPARPPPPQVFYPSDYAPYSIPPPSFYQLRNPDSDEEIRRLQSVTTTTHRRPRSTHHRRRHEESTSEEEYQRSRRNRHEHGADSQSPEPSILDLR